MFVYKHTETIEYVKKKANFSEKYKVYEWITLRIRILRIRNEELSGYYLYMN